MKGVYAVFLFALLSTVSYGQDKTQGKAQAEAAYARAGCGSSDVHFDVKVDKYQHPASQPEAGRALVYVFEEDASEVLSPTMRIGLDGKWMGATQVQSYFFFSVDPGEHRLCTNWQETSDSRARRGAALSFTAEAGKTYYFQIQVGEFRDSTRTLQAVREPEGQFLMAGDGLSTFQAKKPQ